MALWHFTTKRHRNKSICDFVYCMVVVFLGSIFSFEIHDRYVERQKAGCRYA